MSLVKSVTTWIGRRKVNGWRQGKEGPEMKNVTEFLDGKKRYLLLVVFLAQALAELSGHPIGGVVKTVLAILGWDQADSFVPYAQLAQLAATVWAIRDGIIKDLAKRKASAPLN